MSRRVAGTQARTPFFVHFQLGPDAECRDAPLPFLQVLILRKAKGDYALGVESYQFDKSREVESNL